MVLFSAKHPSDVKEVHCEELRALGFPIDSCVEPLPAFAAEAPEGPAADAPPDGADAVEAAEGSGELLQDDDAEDKVPERIIKLRNQVMSLEHRLFHFPKNPFCDICNQARMLSRRVRRKPRDSEVEPDRQSSEKSLPQITYMCVDRLTIPMLLTSLMLSCA